MKTIEGFVSKYDGVENIEEKCLIILNCKDNPLKGEIFPRFVLDGNYSFEPCQKVRIYYPILRITKKIKNRGCYIKAKRVESL